MDITIEDGMFIYKLFDKRDAFPSHIVRMPDASGNIPEHIFYGSISSELLRIARASLKYSDFLEKGRQLLQRMLNQGGSLQKITKLIDKIQARHAEAFFSFNKTTIEVKHDLSEL